MAILVLSAFAAPPASAAEGERVLDEKLSLTGGCTVDTLDPVADPGCPYPAFPAGPSNSFADPRAVTTDDHGNIYVSSFGKKLDGSEGRIDIFGPDGEFISELKTTGPTSLAVDSKGYLYVAARISGSEMPIFRFAPCAPYEPEAGRVEYCDIPVKLAEVGEASTYTGLAINRDNDHLFANFGSGHVREYGSAAEGNARIRTTPANSGGGGVGVAVDATRDLMYASAGLSESRIDIFDLTTVEGEAPGRYKKVGSIEDSAMPKTIDSKGEEKEGELGFRTSLAVDEGTGHLFVLDGGNCHLHEFDEAGKYVTEIEFKFQCTLGGEIGVDNGPSSPNGAESEKGRYLYVPSHKSGVGHSFAFFESQVGAPEVKSLGAENMTEDEVELQAMINPHNLATTYTIELQEEGSGTWTVVEEGTIPAGNGNVEVTAVASSLKPGTSYRFRVVADNLSEGEGGTHEKEAGFATYPRFPLPGGCANALLRTGPSALLPDCRAYELVTPGDPNAHPPIGTGNVGGTFTNRQVSPAGDKLPFIIEGGSLPGLGGTGALLGDPYLATRTAAGWSTAYTGPSPSEATAIAAGTNSPDQGYSFWLAEGSGSAVMGGTTASVRYPDGHSEPLGQGSVGFDREAEGKLISEGGGHIIFSALAVGERQKVTLGKNTTGGTFTLSFEEQTTDPISYDASAGEVEAALVGLSNIGPGDVSVSAPEGSYVVEFTGTLSGIDVPQLVADPSGLSVSAGEPSMEVKTEREGGGWLEPEAPKQGSAVYDRTADGTLHVISIKPDGSSFGAGESANYQNASLDGVGVAFEVGSTLYLRYDNEVTLEVGTGVAFAGVAEGGDRVFYVEAGDLKALDVQEGVIEFSQSGDVTPVQVSPDGTAAYFVSESVLTPGVANPQGEEAQPGAQNLYLSREGELSFVATVTDRDVEGDVRPGFETIDGLGLWVSSVGPNPSGRLANVPARTTPDGGVLLFKSRASLTGYDTGGKAQIYRYDSAGELQCLSCNATGAASGSDATLQSRTREDNLRLFTSQAWLENLRADGRRAFFESSEPLVARDADGLQDVYEWEDQGVGSCTTPGGCLYLISSPSGLRNEYLWAISRSGDDVFFLSSELLTWQDADETPSIYDARVGGGFAEPEVGVCPDEGACRPQPTAPPALTPAADAGVLGKGDNVTRKHCPKGKRKVKRAGKVRCVKKKKHRKHRRAGAERKGARR